MATISDVAKHAGLSKTTVSRVINNSPHVAPEKREKVLHAMKELNYSPNPSARRMRGNIMTSIGVIVPRIVNPFFSYLVDSIEKAAYEHGYQVVIFQSDERREKELSFLEMLKTKQVDAMIMTAIENDWEVIESYKQYGLILLCNEYLLNKGVSTVRVDQMNATFIGVKHLIEKGHRKIAYCTGGLFADDGKDKDRNKGFQKAMKEAGLDVNPQWVFVERHSIEDGKKVADQIIKMEDKPTAIFTGSDEVAGGILVELKSNGFKIPNDMAIIGFDDQPLAEIIDPKLTTIRQPISKMGEKCVEIIVSQNQGKGSEIIDCELQNELVIREST
ncbi:LacI family DNA-binding transcriptional regulator [Bacillus solitudinis]|uniref:LacI family DNA-binding transcriptional regulator n=1 Tax=Bacillus solitudinis TaxID=2014074 RepID=UPI000C233DDE|nr:LacI family DNA-binding transcriptional regulator [Bacillus solitudinis]